MKKTFTYSLIGIGGLLLIVIIFMIAKDIKPISLGMHESVYEQDGIVLEGYDVTTYFAGDLQKGSTDFQVEWNDVSWYFTTEDNMKKFLADPERFVPAFGGYCTKAVSTGFTAPNNPEIFEIHNNRLYIFSNEEVRAEFREDPSTMIQKCQEHWN